MDSCGGNREPHCHDAHLAYEPDAGEFEGGSHEKTEGSLVSPKDRGRL